ncbi:MAG TPA: MFS transporter [Xanthobacteraceae bacterium]|nr:MFS transporter [Xanthobacteraceae bacterium]
MTTAAQAANGGASATRSREAVIAAGIGNALEWYDFAVYGYFVTTISKLFFASGDPVASILATYLVFGIGFVMRPVGSILFGIYGDRHGRRKALSVVIFLMAFSTLAIGLLPTYDQVGVAAPILLVLARLVQGLSAGGEWAGSTAYIVEYAPEGRRGFIGSWQQVSVGSGFLLGSLSGTVLSFALSFEALTSWGWRLPFLFGIVVGAVGAYLRWRLPDTPKYTDIEEHHEISEAPLSEAFKRYPGATFTAFGITLHNTAAYYISLLYMTGYFTTVAKLPQPTAQLIGTICLAIFVILIPFTGMLSDRIGRRPLLMVSCIGYALLAYPLFMLGASGIAAFAFVAQVTMIVFQSCYAGPCPAAYAELFPTRVRYTALSIGYNIAVAVFGGFAPFIATWLIRETGNPLAPAFYVISAAVITLVILTQIRETAFEPLR